MTADTVGGVWSYALTLSRGLEPVGAHITLATMGTPMSPAQRADAAALPHVTVRESSYELEWMDDPWTGVEAAGDWLLELDAAVKPDIVHLNGYVHGVLPWSAPVLMVGHSCVLSWWDAVHGSAAPQRWDRYREAVRHGLQAAQRVVTPTRAMAAALDRHYGAGAAAQVIPNGCAAPGTAQGDALCEPLVLAAGRAWDEAKNLGTLAAAAPAIEWPVYVAGADRHPSGERRPLPHVRQLGLLPAHDLRDWYRRASIFAHPALYEPFGLAPVEAALHGCALVLGDIPSLREVWADAAVFVDPRDAAALAAAVNELISRPRQRAERAAAARARALRFGVEPMVQAYREAYGQLHSRAAGREGAVACAS